MKRSLTVVGLFVLLALGAVASIQALPPGGTGFDDVYYSDNTFTTVVGERYMQCYSGVSRWGQVTQYVDGYSWGCQSEPGGYCERMICDHCDESGCTGCSFDGVCNGCEYNDPCFM